MQYEASLEAMGKAGGSGGVGEWGGGRERKGDDKNEEDNRQKARGEEEGGEEEEHKGREEGLSHRGQREPKVGNRTSVSTH